MPARSSLTPTEAKANPICKYMKNNKVLLVQRVNLSHGENKIWRSTLAQLVKQAGTSQAQQTLSHVPQASGNIQDA